MSETGVLDGTAALVTGASMGLGAALARRLARAGAKVVLVARGEAALARVVEEIRADGGVAFPVAADVGDKEAIHRVAGVAAALVGPIDVLIHNASTLGALPMPLLLDTECEDLERVLAVNLVGPFRLSKVIAGPMVLRGRGLIVQITSDAGSSAYPGWGAYGVSKAALEQLGRVWAAELAPAGVRFWNVDPGEMDTRMHADALPDADRATLASPDAVAARIVEWIARPSEIASGTRLTVPASVAS